MLHTPKVDPVNSSGVIKSYIPTLFYSIVSFVYSASVVLTMLFRNFMSCFHLFCFCIWSNRYNPWCLYRSNCFLRVFSFVNTLKTLKTMWISSLITGLMQWFSSSLLSLCSASWHGLYKNTSLQCKWVVFACGWRLCGGVLLIFFSLLGYARWKGLIRT